MEFRTYRQAVKEGDPGLVGADIFPDPNEDWAPEGISAEDGTDAPVEVQTEETK